MRFEKGQSGNPQGRPKGASNKTTITIEALLEGEAEAITRKAIEKATEGEMAAIRLCMDRLAPPAKDRPVPFNLPPLEKAADAAKAASAIVGVVAAGELTPSEAGEVIKIIDAYARTLQAADIEECVERLERATRGTPRS